MTKRTSTEYQECLAFYQWTQWHPLLRDYTIKNVNEGKRSEKTGYFLKQIGLQPGLPDYHIPIPTSKYHGLWIEMKTEAERHRKKRQNQNKWIENLNKIGHYATYAYGATDAIRIVQGYLAEKI